MAIFQWKGIESSRVSSGEIEARNNDDASHKLRERSVVVTSMVLISGKEDNSADAVAGIHALVGGRKSQAVVKVKKQFRGRKIKVKMLVLFTKKFATMLEAGLPILKTLIMLESQQEDKNFRWVVRSIKEDVETGYTLSEAFSDHPEVFDTVFINLIKAGETSGKLTLFIRKIVVQLERSEKIRAKLKSALSYPVILLCVAVAVIGIMMVKVVPVFQNMFSSMGHTLPGPTQLIVDISNFLRNPMKGGVLVGSLVFMVVGIKYLIRTNVKVRRFYDKYILKLPIIGEVIQKSTLSKIAMVQGNLAAAGVSVIEALDIITNTITNTIYKDAFKIVREGLSSGNQLSALYATCPVFPPTFYQMLAVGEETGKMDEMFEATAQYYEEEFDMAVDHLTEALEPIMIVGMGITVGFIIVAMYMPIFQMGKMVGG
jgi:type IV pilus assembly protein PilC